MSDSVNTTELHQFGADYSYFCTKAAEFTGINLHNYKGRQIYRRLVNYMNRRNIPDFATFAMRLQRDPGEVARLVEYLTINVSDLRNPEHWCACQGDYAVGLARAHKGVGAGSASPELFGCDHLCWCSVDDVFILGTDIDETSLGKARAAKYTSAEVKSGPKPLLRKYFRKEADLHVVQDSIRRMVSFRRHDLLSSEYPGSMDLIICRNVIIYYSEHSKKDVIARLASSLRPACCLWQQPYSCPGLRP